MDLKMIEQIIKVVENSSINTFEFELDGAKIKLQKSNDGNIKYVTEAHEPSVTQVKQLNNITKTSNVEVSAKNELVENYHLIKSPIVGAFYESAVPGKSAFVKVGDKVTKGKTLCIIEAMKVMNEIESDVDGVIIEILASDGKMVEFGEVLFKVETN